MIRQLGIYEIFEKNKGGVSGPLLRSCDAHHANRILFSDRRDISDQTNQP